MRRMFETASGVGELRGRDVEGELLSFIDVVGQTRGAIHQLRKAVAVLEGEVSSVTADVTLITGVQNSMVKAVESIRAAVESIGKESRERQTFLKRMGEQNQDLVEELRGAHRDEVEKLRDDLKGVKTTSKSYRKELGQARFMLDATRKVLNGGPR
jgi:chromosome segregation ATPase